MYTNALLFSPRIDLNIYIHTGLEISSTTTWSIVIVPKSNRNISNKRFRTFLFVFGFISLGNNLYGETSRYRRIIVYYLYVYDACTTITTWWFRSRAFTNVIIFRNHFRWHDIISCNCFPPSIYHSPMYNIVAVLYLYNDYDSTHSAANA